jgi:aspartokinase-like uncharacterized kinase
VIKAGGSLLAHVEALDRLLAAIAGVARTQNVVIIPGGGPFADAVREVDARLGLGDEEAHWMAVLAMDQYAHLLAARLPIGAVVRSRPEVDAALGDGRVPVLAPSQWLLSSDPLPHSWEVTSDSIAAWVAGQLEAQRLLLVKPPDARGPDLVDSHFKRALTSSVDCECLPVDAAIQLLNQIAGSVNPAVETT